MTAVRVVMGRMRLSTVAARRIALAAQGFGGPGRRRGRATSRQVQRVIDTVGIIQIDSVNVVSRSHYLPFYSRLGPHDSGLVDRARDRAPRRLVEYWAHEASLVPALDLAAARLPDAPGPRRVVGWDAERQA